MLHDMLKIFSLQFPGHEGLPAFEEEINKFLLQKLLISQRVITCTSGLSIFLFHQENNEKCREKVKIFYSSNGIYRLATDYNAWTKINPVFAITDRHLTFGGGYSYLIVFYQ